MKLKVCSKCKEEKSLVEFSKDKQKLDGYSYWCKNCVSDYKKLYREQNKDKIKEKKKQDYIKNKDIVSIKGKLYRDNNKEKVKESKKLYSKNNKDKLRKKSIAYNKKNKDKIKEKKKQDYIKNKDKVREEGIKYRKKNKDKLKKKAQLYHKNNKDKIKEKRALYFQNNKDKVYLQRKNKLNTDIQCKLATNLRIRLNQAIKNNSKAGSAVRDLGCTIDQLKDWLERQFMPGMTWDNYGNKEGQWSIDHEYPLSLVDLTKREQLLPVVHYTNLQPLWHLDNLSKGNNLV